MPILPENKKRYPKDWPQISYRVRSEANWRCEWCGLEDGAFVVRNPKTGEVLYASKDPSMELETLTLVDGLKAIKIVLTVAHVNHIPEDCNRENLKALCQRCHNRWDAVERSKNRRRRARKRLQASGQQDMFNVSDKDEA